MIRPMIYLSADLLPKVFLGLICIICLSCTYNSYQPPKQAVLFSPVITAYTTGECLLISQYFFLIGNG